MVAEGHDEEEDEVGEEAERESSHDDPQLPRRLDLLRQRRADAEVLDDAVTQVQHARHAPVLVVPEDEDVPLAALASRVLRLRDPLPPRHGQDRLVHEGLRQAHAPQPTYHGEAVSGMALAVESVVVSVVWRHVVAHQAVVLERGGCRRAGRGRLRSAGHLNP